MRTDNQTSRSGFQLIELMVAMVAVGIFAVAAGSMLVFTWKGWHNNLKSVQMQRDTTIAMRVMEREIRRTPIGGFTPGTSTLTCFNTNTLNTVVFAKSGDRLNMQVNSDPVVTLIDEYVQSFASSTNANGSVAVNLALSTGSDSSSSTMVVYTRN